MYEAKTTRPKPPRSPNLPTNDERIAAVEGKLEPRKQKGSKAQEDLRRTGSNEMPVGHPLGVKTGLPVYMAICYAFQQNERAKAQQLKGNKDAKVLTDKELSAWLKAEFPGRQSAYFDRIQWLRGRYNVGFFTRNMKPKVQSHKYDSGGECIDPVYRRRR